MVTLNPYLSFESSAREALEFYQSVLGGDLDVMTFGEMPGMPGVPPEAAPLVMHGQLTTPHGLTLMASDTGGMMPYTAPTSGVTVALTGGPDDHEYIRGAYDKLVEGGNEVMPMEKAPWGDYYGQLTDRYGISWMFDVGTEDAPA